MRSIQSREFVVGFLDEIRDRQNLGNYFWFFCGLTILVSVMGVLLLGMKSLFLLLIPPLLYFYFAYERSLIYIFFLIIPFVPFLLYGEKVLVTYVLALFIFSSWVVRKLIIPNERVAVSRFLIVYMLIFLFAVIVSALNGGVTFPELEAVIKITVFFSLICMLYDIVSPRATMVILAVFTLPVIIDLVFLLKIYSETSGLLGWLSLYRLKPAGIYANSNITGGIVLCALPLWFSVALWVRDRRWRIPASVISALLIVSLILSNSRSALAGMLCVLLVYSIRARKFLRFAFAAIFISILVYSIPAVNSLLSAGLRIERGGSSRGKIWENTEKIIRGNMPFGVGLGNFPEAYGSYFETAEERAFFVKMQHAHNLLLGKTAELGFLGAVLVIIFYIVPFVITRRALPLYRSDADRAVIFGILGVIIGMFVRSLFEGSGIVAEGELYPDLLIWVWLIILIKLSEKPRLYSHKLLPS